MNRSPAEPRVLIIDGSLEAADLLSGALIDYGYTVERAYDGEEGLRRAAELEPDVVVVDLVLPKGSGLDLARALRTRRDVPILMTSARGAETDCVVALELGADDYVTKPFRPREVVARISAILRRSRCACGAFRGSRDDGASATALRIDQTSHTVWLDGRLVPLTPTEFRILDALALHPGQILTRGQLLDHVAADGDAHDRTLDKHVANLRKKIESNPARPRFVKTVHGVGYTYAGPG